MVKTNLNKGFVTQIIGPVLDIAFTDGNLPPIYSALKIELADGSSTIVEVQQFRTISAISTNILSNFFGKKILFQNIYKKPYSRSNKKFFKFQRHISMKQFENFDFPKVPDLLYLAVI